MAKMSFTKKAWQRADRLKRAGISNKALEVYQQEMDEINKSDLTQAEKNAQKKETAKKFLRKKESTKTGIKEKIKKSAEKKVKKAQPKMPKEMSITKKAWQRADRLKRAGIRNDALVRYQKDMARINESNLSRAEKNALKKKVSEKFLQEVTSTKKGIRGMFDTSAGGIAKEAIKSLKEQAEYVDAAETSKSYLTAKALGISSDQIRYALDMLDAQGLEGGEREAAFIDLVDKMSEFVYMNDRASADDVTRFIHEWGKNNL